MRKVVVTSSRSRYLISLLKRPLENAKSSQPIKNTFRSRKRNMEQIEAYKIQADYRRRDSPWAGGEQQLVMPKGVESYETHSCEMKKKNM